MANLKASTFNGTLTLSSISGAAQTVPNSYGAYLHLGTWADGRTAAGAVLVNTAYRADYATDLFDMNISRFTNNSGYITAYGAQGAAGDFYIDDDYGKSIIGLYASTRYQGVYAMGDAYKLAADGTTPGNLYGIAWTHTNVGGESKAGLGHQALFMMNGTTYTAIGEGIWTSGTITTTSHGTSANWKSAYDWGNHASAGYAASSHTHTPSQVGLGNVSNAAQVTTSYNSSLNSDSRNSRGVTRLYRRDDDSDYSVQTYWTGARWRLYGYNGDSGHADTHVGYADSAGSAPANGGQSDRVTINYNNDSNSTYQMLWGSGNSVYGTGAIYCNPSSDTIYSTSLRGASNVAGTGEATHHPAGIYSQGTNWLYGTQYQNGNAIDGVGALYATIFYDRNDTGYYSDPTGTSNLEHLIINRIENYGWHTNSVWNTGGMFYVGEAGDGGAYPIQVNSARWDLSVYVPNGPVWARGFQDLSDLRKKTNLADLQSPLEKVLALRGVTYNWIDDANGPTHSGFIAQEVEPIIPHVVTTSIDPETLGDIKGIAYSEIIPYLVESIKIQQATIQNLEARLAALENNS